MLSVTLGGMALCRRGSEPRSGIGTGRSAGRQLHGDGLNRRSGHDAPATTALVSAPRAACWAASASVMSLNCWTPKLRSAAQPDGTALPATGCCARGVHAAVPEDPEAADPLALMLLTDARRPARTRADGELIPLAEQDRTLWDRHLIAEGVALIEAWQRGQVGEYQVQAAIAAVHDQAASQDDTDWPEILSLYGLLERMTGNPMVTLNRAIAAAMAHGPATGLALLDGLSERLGDHHRLHSVRAHLLDLAGDSKAAIGEFRAAAARTTNLREQHYLTTKAARLAAELGDDQEP